MPTLLEILKQDENFEAKAAAISDMLKEHRWQSFAELVGGFIKPEIYLEDDVWPSIIGEIDFTTTTIQEFQTPVYAMNQRAFRFENGMTVPIAKITTNKVTTEPQYIATPRWQFDTKDLESGELGSANDVSKWAADSLLLEKNLTGLRLFTAGIVDHDSGLRVIVKAETEDDMITGTDQYKWYATARKVFNRERAEIQDITTGGAIHMVVREITVGDLEMAKVDLAKYTVHQMKNCAVPTADGLPSDEVLFLEGDCLIIHPEAGNMGKVMDVEGSYREPSHFKVEWMWRTGYKWIKWDVLGFNKKRIRRVYIVDPLVVGEVLAVENFQPSEFSLRTDKAVDWHSIYNATTPANSGIVIRKYNAGDPTATPAVPASWDDVTPAGASVSIHGTMREFTVNVPELEPGEYVLHVTSSLKDLGEQTGSGNGTAFKAGFFGQFGYSATQPAHGRGFTV